MNSKALVTLLTIGTLAGSAVTSLAVAPPGVLNHQGRIAVSGTNWDTTGYFKFALVSGDPAVETLWTNDDTNTGTPGGEPTAAVPVTVTKGHYAVGLGDIDATSNMTNAVPASHFADNDDVWLRIWFSTDDITFELLSPDRRVTSAGYALSASKAQSVADGGVTSVMLANGAVIAAKLADGAVSGLDSPDASFTEVVRVNDLGRTGIGAVSNENAIVPKDSDGTGLSFPQSVAVQGNYAYVADGITGVLQIFDVSNPAAIVAKDSDGTGLASPWSVAVQGDYAYVVDWGGIGVLQIFDVSNPAAIVPKDSDGAAPADPRSVAVQGDYAYVVATNRMQIFDVSNPDAIVARGSSVTASADPFSVAVQGDYAYVVGRTPDILEIFDVSDPDAIVPLDSDSTGLGGALAVAVQGDYAYVADLSGGLQVFDVSNPDAIAPKDSDGTGLSFAQSVAVQGNYAYVVDGSTGVLQVFDVSNPEAIVPLDSDGTGLSEPRSVAVQGNHAYVVDESTDVLQIFELASAVEVDGSVQLTSGGLVFPDASVQATAFGPNAVTSNELADGAVGSSEIADGSISADKIAAGAVGSSEIADGSITASDLDASSIGLWTASGGNVYRGSGNVGIGASAPSHRLDVVGPWDAGVPGQVAVRTHPTVGAFAWLGTDSSGAKIGVSSGSRIDFYISTGPTATTPLMRLTSAGNLGIGDVFPSGKLHVAGSAGNNTGVWSNFSDERLKENIVPMASGSLKRLLQLKGMRYDYIRDDLREGYPHERDGWIAQDVEEVFPEWVNEAHDGMKMVTPVGFRALAVEALRELREEKDAAIQALERKNSRLQRESAALRKRLDSLEKTVARLAAEKLTTEDKRINAK